MALQITGIQRVLNGDHAVIESEIVSEIKVQLGTEQVAQIKMSETASVTGIYKLAIVTVSDQVWVGRIRFFNELDITTYYMIDPQKTTMASTDVDMFLDGTLHLPDGKDDEA